MNGCELVSIVGVGHDFINDTGAAVTWDRDVVRVSNYGDKLCWDTEAWNAVLNAWGVRTE